MFTAYLRDTDSIFGTGDTEYQAICNAEQNYLKKYPEEENNINNIQFDAVEN